MKYVVDTSVAAKLFLAESLQNEARALFEAANNKYVELSAPTLILYEINNALIASHLSVMVREMALFSFAEMINSDVLQLIPENMSLLIEAGKVADTDTKSQGYISSYDATFHALALQLGATLITADKSHYRKTKDSIGSIVLLDKWSL